MFQLSKGLVLCLLVGLVGLLFAVLIWKSIPAWQAFGWGFLTHSDWNPAIPQFGALSALMGTLVSAFLAIGIAAPLSLLIAFVIQEYLPSSLWKTVRLGLDLCMGIPSIVYGMWGMWVLIPFMAEVLEPFLQKYWGALPLLRIFVEGPTIGLGLLTAALILAIMLIPMIVGLMVDLMRQVPPPVREAAYGLGAYKGELLRLYCRQLQRPFWGTILLALGRALGETMAVSFVLGNSHALTRSLLKPATTLSATIANEFAEATGPLYSQSLFALGLILLVMSFALILVARILYQIPKEK